MVEWCLPWISIILYTVASFFAGAWFEAKRVNKVIDGIIKDKERGNP